MFDAAAHAAFVEAVQAELAARGEAFTLHDAYVEIEGFELPLLPLAQQCAAAPRASWRALIAAGLAQRLTEEKLGRELDSARGDFEKARRVLKLRVQRAETVGANAISAPLAGDLRAVLVLDLPSFITPVRPADLASWEKPAGAVVAAAMENVKASEQVELQPMEIAGTKIFAVSGRSVFVATLGLAAEDLVGKSTEFGALLAMPSAHILLCHSLVDTRSLKALEAMAAGALQAFDSGPSPLSPDLFWKKGDRFLALPVRREEGEVKCELPREFDEQVAQRLPPPA